MKEGLELEIDQLKAKKREQLENAEKLQRLEEEREEERVESERMVEEHERNEKTMEKEYNRMKERSRVLMSRIHNTNPNPKFPKP